MSTGELSESIHLVEMLVHIACDLSLLAFPWQPYRYSLSSCLRELRPHLTGRRNIMGHQALERKRCVVAYAAASSLCKCSL